MALTVKSRRDASAFQSSLKADGGMPPVGLEIDPGLRHLDGLAITDVGHRAACSSPVSTGP